MPINRERMRHHLPSGIFVGILLAIIVLGAIAFIYFGIYNIAADAPHTRPVYAVIESLRDRSIAVHARGIEPPADLASMQRVRSEEHTSELQSLMRISYAVFCLKQKRHNTHIYAHQ